MHNKRLPVAQYDHCVGFHDAFDTADFFDAVVDFGDVHASDYSDYVVFACDFVDSFYVGERLDFPGDLHCWVRWVSC